MTDINVGKADDTDSQLCLAHQTVLLRQCLHQPIRYVSCSFVKSDVTSLLLKVT